VLDEPVRMMADLNTPMAMIVIGWYLAAASFRPALTCPGAWLVGAMRLILIPCAVLGVLWLCRPPESAMAVATVVAASAPVAALTTMFAARYERDVPVSVGLVSLTTLLSILTMPPLVGYALWLFRR
jgi:predicted permease